MSNFRDAGQIGPRWRERSFLRLIYLIDRILPRFIRVRLWSIGDALRNVDLQRQISGGTHECVLRREEIWDRIIAHLLDESRRNSSVPAVFEFGVAYGYATDYFLRAISLPTYRHFGFDSFIGLARPFREFDVGAFSTGGEPPNIDDSRVDWIIGDVYETVTPTRFSELRRDLGPVCVFLDLDLYGPTRHVLESALSDLRAGDVVYFDEPVDAEESVLIRQLLAGEFGSVSFSLICGSPISCALRVDSPN